MVGPRQRTKPGETGHQFDRWEDEGRDGAGEEKENSSSLSRPFVMGKNPSGLLGLRFFSLFIHSFTHSTRDNLYIKSIPECCYISFLSKQGRFHWIYVQSFTCLWDFSKVTIVHCVIS